MTALPLKVVSKRAEKVLGLPITPDRWRATLTITPAKAAMLLAAMPQQRPVNRTSVKKFIRAIEQGKLRLTHQGLACNTKGELIDGQHRLMACVQTDTSIEVDITFNESDDNYLHYDRGWSRSIAHNLLTQGMESGTQAMVMQAAGRLLYQLDDGKQPWSMDLLYDADTLHEVLLRHPLLTSTVELVCSKGSRYPRPPKGPLAAFGTVFREVDETLALAFLDGVMTGEGLRDGDPALVLRASLASSGSRKATKARDAFMVRLVHGWNNVRAGRTVRALFSTTRTGEFPAISGYKIKADG